MPRQTSRRAVATAGAASLVAALGLTAWVGAASADACPAWTDPKGDATTGQEGVPGTEDAQMDITAASFGTVGDSVVGTVTTDGLGSSSSDAGDEFGVRFTVAGQDILLFVDRTKPLGQTVDVSAGFYNFTTDSSGGSTATATFDVPKKTVTITGKIAELAKAAGKPVAGQAVTDLRALTSNQVGLGSFTTPYDDAPTKLTTTVGTACEGGAPAPAPTGAATATPAPSATAAPSASATPTPSGSATPTPSGSATPAPSGSPAPGALVLPRAGCFTFTDPKGDATAPGGVAEPDLDFLGMTLQSTPETTRVFLKVDNLAGRPNTAPGHAFSAFMTVGGKLVAMRAAAYDPATLSAPEQAAADATSGLPVSFTPPTSLRVAGALVKSSLKATFDVTNEVVVLSIPTKELTTATGGAFVAGATLTAVSARNATTTPAAGGFFVDSTAKDNAAAATPAEKWTVGDNACFSSPTALSSVGATTAQFGDRAAVAVQLADGSGKPLADKRVQVSLPGTTAFLTTGADGIARLSATMRTAAEVGTLTASFEGGDGLERSAMSVPFTVTVEKTVLTASGRKGAVTAALRDDDRSPVAGQVVTFTQGSVKRTARTDAKGVAKAGGFKPGQAVKVSYAGSAGRYAAAAVTARG